MALAIIFIYFYRFEEDYDLETFKRGARVYFRIGFNYRSPMALDLQIIDL